MSLGLHALWCPLAAAARYNRGMSEATNCKMCGARILWITTQNNRRMPLDHEAERRFVVDGATMIAKLRNTYACHFDTCKKR